MADAKISALTALGTAPATTDLVPLVDVSDTTQSPDGTTKKMTVANLIAAMPQASGSTDGLLTQADWTTFNGKVGGSGTAGNLPKFSGSGTLADSLLIEGTNTIEQRNGTNAQTWNLYRTYSGAGANYERLFATWNVSLSEWRIGTEKAGTGVARDLSFYRDGSRYIKFTSSEVLFDENLKFNNGSATISWVTRSQISTPANGNILLQNNGGTDFDRLQLGGTTSSFPALKRSSAAVAFRLADDSADASITAAGATLTGQLIINRGTLTALSPAIDITSTWNNAAVTFTGLRYNVTDTASNAASLLMDLQVGGSSRTTVSKAGSLVCAGSIRSGASIFLGGSTSYALVPGPSGGIIEQYNSTNPQTFNIYNTFTSSTNHERGFLSWVSNEFRIGTEKGSGGGTARALVFQTDGTSRLTISASGGISSSGGFTIAASSGYVFLGRSVIRSGADGQLRFENNAGTDFSLLQFGLATSAAPALKRNSATLECRLADDSGFAMFAAEFLSITDGITAPSAVAGRARIYVDAADGDLKVIFADGTVKTIVTDS